MSAKERSTETDVAPGGHDGEILEARFGRRRFLEVSGLSFLGILGAGPALAATRDVAAPDPALTVEAGDPIADLAAGLEYDVERIFRFVTDEIRYEPYEGVLRGASGTLRGRAGNSADQALLLAALLEASLVPVRFLSGRIDEATAGRLLASASMAADEAADILVDDMAPVTAPLQLDAEIQATVDRLPEIANAARSVAAEQLRQSVGTIMAALSEAGIELPVARSDLPALERDRHVWVQAAVGADWLDLDATVAGAEAGLALAVPSGDAIDAIPDELRHRVEFEVIGERASGGRLSTESLVGHAAYADELAGVPIMLLHERPGALEGLGIGLAGVLTGSSAYQPVLQVGDRTLIGVSGLMLGGGGALESLEGLDALDEIGELADAEPAAEATAEWLDVRITPPLGEPSTVRRTIFDRIGDDVRSSGRIEPALIAPAPMVSLDEDHPSEYLPLRSLHLFAVASGPTPLEGIAATATDETGEAALERSAQLFHVSRDILSSELGLERGVHAFLDGPNVTGYTLAATASGSPVPVESYGLDILARSFGHVVVADTVAGQPSGVVSGVLAHVVERILVGDALPADLAPDVPAVSVGRIFESAAEQGIAVRAVRGQVPEGVAVPEPARPHLERALADGWVAIVPEEPVAMGASERTGWWLVDPVTGRTEDMLDDGRGGAITQYIGNQAAIVWRHIRPYVKFGACLRLIVAFISVIVTTALADTSGQVLALASLITGAKPGRWGCTC